MEVDVRKDFKDWKDRLTYYATGALVALFVLWEMGANCSAGIYNK